MTDKSTPKGYTPLAECHKFKNRVIAVIGGVSDFLEPMQSTKGTRDWTCTITICDMSLPLGLKARLFQKSREFMPLIASIGEAVILTNVRVTEYLGEITLLSSSGFSWIVVGLDKQMRSHPTSPPTMTTGDFHYIVNMSQRLGIKGNYTSSQQSFNSPSVGANQGSSGQIGRPGRRKLELVRNMECDKFYDMIGEVVKTYPGIASFDVNNFTIYITDYTANSLLYNYDWGQHDEEDGIHWHGPWGRNTLQITMWDRNAEVARDSLQEGSYIHIVNMRAKRNPDGRLEGSLHGDRKYPEKVNFTVLSDSKDPRLAQIRIRKREYERKFNDMTQNYENAMKNKVSQQKKRSNKSRKTEEQQLEEQQSEEQQLEKRPMKQPSKRKGEEREEEESPEDRKRNQKKSKKEVDIQNKHSKEEENTRKIELNSLIKCERPSLPETLIGDIMSLDYQNRIYRICCRVIDFMPQQLEDFCKPQQMKDDDEIDPEVENFDGKKWVWRFALLVEGTDGVLMRLIVEGPDGDYLTKITAGDLHNNKTKLQQLRRVMYLLWGNLENRKRHEVQKLLERGNPPPGPIKKNNRRSKGKKAKNKERAKAKMEANDSYSGVTDPDNSEFTKFGKYFHCCAAEFGINNGGGIWTRAWRLCKTTTIMGGEYL